MVRTNYEVTKVPALYHLPTSAWSVKKSPFSGESRPSDKGGGGGGAIIQADVIRR